MSSALVRTREYRIELRFSCSRRFTVLYREPTLGLVLARWVKVVGPVKAGVSGRRGELRLRDRDGKVLETIVSGPGGCGQDHFSGREAAAATNPPHARDGDAAGD